VQFFTEQERFVKEKLSMLLPGSFRSVIADKKEGAIFKTYACENTISPALVI